MRLTYGRDHEGILREQFGHEAPVGPVPLAGEECRRLLARNTIGRVAVLAGGSPRIFPVTYGLDRDDAIVFRSDRGTKRRVAERAPAIVSFEVDERDPTTGAGAAVIVRGVLTPVFDLVEAARLTRLGIRPWADAARRGGWLRIRPDDVSGWILPPGG